MEADVVSTALTVWTVCLPPVRIRKVSPRLRRARLPVSKYTEMRCRLMPSPSLTPPKLRSSTRNHLGDRHFQF